VCDYLKYETFCVRGRSKQHGQGTQNAERDIPGNTGQLATLSLHTSVASVLAPSYKQAVQSYFHSYLLTYLYSAAV